MNEHHRRRITHEEAVYRDVFPFVRLYQGFWQSALVLFILMSLIPILHWKSYVDAFARSGLDRGAILRLVGLNLVAIFVYTAVALWIGLAVCRMRRWIGIVALIYCVSALVFTALYVGCLVLGLIGFLFGVLFAGTPPGLGGFILIFYISVISFIAPFCYFCFLGLLAGRRIAVAEAETRRIVAEIDTQSASRSIWLSKVMGLPFPIDHIRKHRWSSTALFLVSGIAFSSFATFAPFAVVFASMSLLFILISQASIAGFSAEEPDLTMMQIMKYSPLIFLGLASLALIIGRTARARARQLAIRSILNSQQSDSRPPILFLRAFRDDRVMLAPASVPLLGRLMNFLQAKGSLDVLLLEEGTTLGPVVAIGNPNDPIPPYGAARGYFSDGDWRQSVSKLASDSQLIIICLDTAEGVLWELEHLTAEGHAAKTLFLLNPDAKEPATNKALRETVCGRLKASARTQLDLRELSESDEPVIGFFFSQNGRAEVGVSSAFSEASYLLMTRWFLRTIGPLNQHHSS